MIREVSITETEKAVFFECTTDQWVCIKCLNHYEQPRDRCLKCKESKFKIKEETKLGFINKTNDRWGCSCIYGSWFRFGSFWINNYPDVKCRHYRKAFKKWKFRKI